MKIGKYIAASVAASMMVLGVAASPANASVNCKAVFLSPHQDDETLSMGSAIRQHVKALGGGKVCVALMTTGSHTGAKSHLSNGRGLKIGDNGTVHTNPNVWDDSRFNNYNTKPDAEEQSNVTVIGKDGKPRGGSGDEIRAARDREFIAAVMAMGVPRDNIYFGVPRSARNAAFVRPLDYNDGSANQAAARDFVDKAIKYWGSAVDLKTLSDKELGHDHRMLGQSVRENASRVNSVRFYWPKYNAKPAGLPTTHPQAVTGSDREAVLQAGREYGKLSHAEGRYAIGWASVGGIFGGPALAIRYQTVVNGSWTGPKPIASNLQFFNDPNSWVHY